MTNRTANRITAEAAEVKRLWNLMCEFDKVPTDSKFVTFSADNPFAFLYNNAMGRLLTLGKAARVRKARYEARRDAIESLGMHEVRGALGGRYVE